MLRFLHSALRRKHGSNFCGLCCVPGARAGRGARGGRKGVRFSRKRRQSFYYHFFHGGHFVASGFDLLWGLHYLVASSDHELFEGHGEGAFVAMLAAHFELALGVGESDVALNADGGATHGLAFFVEHAATDDEGMHARTNGGRARNASA